MSIFERVSKEHLLLPHEMALVDRDYKVMIARQEKHGELLGEAMDQSSETFHDNAPAEAIRDDQEVLMREVKPVLFILKHHVFVDYPDPTSAQAALGSRTSIRVNHGEEFAVDIIGYRDAERDEEDVEQVSYLSPIGKAILGHKPGDVTEAMIGDASRSIEVIAIDQLAIKEHYRHIVPQD